MGILRRQWFLIGLAVALAVGIVGWVSLQSLGEARWLRYAIVASVLFLMALPLEARTIGRSLRHPWPPLLACLINLGLLPLFAWLMSLALPADTAMGLLIAATTPCTMASAAVWTRRAGGNDAVAVMVTIATNLSCFLVTPMWLAFMIGGAASSVAFELWSMVGKLGVLVVAPIFAAQAMRRFPPLGSWATERKRPLSVAAQSGILGMVFIGAINLGEKLHGQGLGATLALEWAAILLAVLTVHLVMLAAGHVLSELTGVGREDRIAVGFAGSQKTLMVGLQVAIDCGVTILPMVAYHVGQLLVDTVIADRLAERGGGLK